MRACAQTFKKGPNTIRRIVLAKLTITALRANSTSMRSVMEAPKKTVESLKVQLQGKDVQGSISQKASLTVSPLMITQGANEPGRHKSISVQNGKMADRIESNRSTNAFAANKVQFRTTKLVLLPSLQSGKQSFEAKNERNLKSPDVLEVQLNFNSVADVNEHYSFVQKKDQMKKNVGNSNDSGRKQVMNMTIKN
ncbi:hypothetical protein LOAG_08431 [Loa loa]|uniref:Uncharacterized protein n=1 Tax=Loa loa TaxID=7209 RepID=A0A1S0TTR2_LOALO|nr:hypothetical protein LOAG_08431 [Loa loa]EFO20060.2 hypothetical protein LOAG_08431 [Loa loa]